MQSGRSNIAREVAGAMLRDLEGPAYAQLPPHELSRRRAPFAYLLGLLDAVLGKESALRYVEVLDQPHYRGNAWRVGRWRS